MLSAASATACDVSLSDGEAALFVSAMISADQRSGTATIVTWKRVCFVRVMGDFRVFPCDFDFRPFLRLDRDPSQLADQPVGGFCIEKFVGEAQSRG